MMKTHQRAALPAPKWASRVTPGRPWTVCGHAIQTDTRAGGIPRTHMAKSVGGISCINCLRGLSTFGVG